MDGITTIIFDCFGVLYPDYAANFTKKHADAFAAHKTETDEIFYKIDTGVLSQADFYDAFAAIAGVDAVAAKQEMEADLVFDPTLIDLIRRLRESYKIGLISNAGPEEISIIQRDGLDELFHSITVSYEAGSVKPEPEIFALALSRLNSKAEECVFVDDNIKNIEAANQAGIKGIHYPVFGSVPEQLKNL